MKKSNTALAPYIHAPAPALETPALDPNELGSMAQAAEAALLHEGESENTLRSYRSALRYWTVWYALRYRQAIALPVPVAAVLQFVVDHAVRRDQEGLAIHELPKDIDRALVEQGCKSQLGPLSLNTVLHRISVLSKAHQLQEADNPCAHPRVRELLAKTRRAYAKRGELPSKKPALTREPLEALIATCDDSLVGLRDRALLYFAFSSGGRRRSEVTAATMANTRREGDAFVFTLATSKTNQAGTDRDDNDKPIAGAAAGALAAWLQASNITSGAIFRRVRRGGVVGEPLSPAAVNDIVKKRCALAGLPDDFSAHSLRSGFVTEAGRQGIPLADAMAMTGHRSTSTLLGYFRKGQIVTSRAAKLLDD